MEHSVKRPAPEQDQAHPVEIQLRFQRPAMRQDQAFPKRHRNHGHVCQQAMDVHALVEQIPVNEIPGRKRQPIGGIQSKESSNEEPLRARADLAVQAGWNQHAADREEKDDPDSSEIHGALQGVKHVL